ncbi:hypothetical protein [Kitasatospora paranensis]|uniref:Uncharacterized protein n=1 Tax=Kitasatospora paranensis TaxID=258053 RepID=A0ABW2FTT9_9ACTN
MALREHTGSAGQAVRYGRHSRPGPFGGRLRLPTIKFSGAAMAMSTVVGISIATTWLLNEQQGVGRRPGMSNVGASPPLPSPDSPAASTAAAPVLAAQSAAPQTAGDPAAPTRTSPHGTATAAGNPRPGTSRAPSPSPSPSTGRGGTTAAPAGLAPPGPAKGTGTPQPGRPPKPSGDALSGQARVERFGPSGTRHTVVLTVRRQLTALQVELRLERPEALPGTVPWCSLPGVVTTVAVEHGILVYRWTLPVGMDIAPGRYAFEVLGSRPAGDRAGAPETWSAAAFVLDGPQAVAVRGIFG